MGIESKNLSTDARVSHLEKSVSFYRDGLGLSTGGIIGREFGAVAFFDLAGGLKLALWSQSDVTHDWPAVTA